MCEPEHLKHRGNLQGDDGSDAEGHKRHDPHALYTHAVHLCAEVDPGHPPAALADDKVSRGHGRVADKQAELTNQIHPAQPGFAEAGDGLEQVGHGGHPVIRHAWACLFGNDEELVELGNPQKSTHRVRQAAQLQRVT